MSTSIGWRSPRPSHLRRRTFVVLLAACAALVLPAATVPAQAAAPAEVVLVHGVRGLLADVVLDGQTVLKGFAFERATDPLPIKPGRHKVQVYRSGQAHTSPVITAELSVHRGQRLTAAVGFDPQGKPKVFVFDDALGRAMASSSAVAIRNIANVDPVSVSLDGKRSGSTVAAGKQSVLAADGGKHALSIKAGEQTLSQPAMTSDAGRVLVVYVVGQDWKHSLSLVATSIRPASADVQAAISSGGEPPAAWGTDGTHRSGTSGATLAVVTLALASGALLLRPTLASLLGLLGRRRRASDRHGRGSALTTR